MEGGGAKSTLYDMHGELTDTNLDFTFWPFYHCSFSAIQNLILKDLIAYG